MNNPSISQEGLEMLVSGYVLNDLGLEEAQQFNALRRDPAYSRKIDALIAQTEASLEATYLPAEVSPSPQLRDSILTAFAEATDSVEEAIAPVVESIPADAAPAVGAAGNPVLEPVPEIVLRSPSLPRWAKALGALAAVVIAALAGSNYWLWRSLQNQSQLLQAAIQAEETAQASLRQVALQPTERFSQVTAAEVSVTVELDPESLKGTLEIENLPPLEAGQVYVLWTVLRPNAPFTTDDKGAILTHVFTVEAADGRQSQPLALPPAFQTAPEFVQAVAITVEDAAAPQVHEAAPILIEQL